MIAYDEFTSPNIARALLKKLCLTRNDLFLEPSAGYGDLVRPIINREVPMPKIGLLIEIDEHRHERLTDLVWPSKDEEGHDIPMIAVIGDFLTMESLYRPTAIAMRPPATDGQDIEHIKQAYRVLAPGGRMVAITGESAFLPRTQFREWLDRRDAIVDRVPPDSFEGTTAAAHMIYLRKSETVTDPLPKGEAFP